MKKALVVVCALTALAAFGKERRSARPDLSRPMLHFRHIAGAVPVGDATDVYWESINELVEPTHTVLFRTRFGADGVPQGATTVVSENDDYSSTQVASVGSSAIAMWSTRSELLASPLLDARLTNPAGKFIAQYVQYPRWSCGPADCVVAWESGGSTLAAILDSEANVVAGPFSLPQGFAPSRMMLTERGIFYVRHVLKEVRAALIGRDGVVQYDVRITGAEPMQFETSPLAVAFDGSSHVLAFLENGRDDGEVRMVKIAANGALGPQVKILDSDTRGSGLGMLSLAWNGETYVLGAGYGFVGYEFLVRLDANFARAASPISTAPGSPYPLRTIGRNILFGMSHDNRASVFMLTEDGRMTPPVLLREPARRRTVR